MMLNHVLTEQCSVNCPSAPTGPDATERMNTWGLQDKVQGADGWSTIVHPFAPILGGPATGPEDVLINKHSRL